MNTLFKQKRAIYDYSKVRYKMAQKQEKLCEACGKEINDMVHTIFKGRRRIEVGVRCLIAMMDSSQKETALNHLSTTGQLPTDH